MHQRRGAQFRPHLRGVITTPHIEAAPEVYMSKLDVKAGRGPASRPAPCHCSSLAYFIRLLYVRQRHDSAMADLWFVGLIFVVAALTWAGIVIFERLRLRS
jgi:hypothetical protein